LKLLSVEKDEISQPPTTSVEANLHFLRGVYETDKGGPSNQLRAMEHFENAIKQDPRFAVAYSSIAGTYIAMAGETMPGNKAYPKAKEYIDHALTLDPELSHAHCWKGMLAFQYDWDWIDAEKSLRKAIDFGPSNWAAHGFLARVLASLARFDEAVSEMKRAYELDPASPWNMEYFGVVYYMAGMNQEARDMFLRALDLNPMFAKARMGLAFVDAAEMKVDDAKVEADAAATIDREAFFQANRAMVHASVGSYARAREILEKILAAKEVYVAPALISAIYYNLGDLERGHEWMKKARDERDPTIPWLNRWPILGAARKDSRFVNLLQELKLP
jgi:tetratricopeptide (TPR) repeat protein